MNAPQREGVVTDLMIANAKQIPIDDIIDVDSHGLANCIWHNERTPSMKYYRDQNTVYCFGCQKYGDSIEVYRHLHDLDFLPAVKQLQGHGYHQGN